jgi:hypothetical protein
VRKSGDVQQFCNVIAVASGLNRLYQSAVRSCVAPQPAAAMEVARFKIQGDAVPDATDYADGIGGYNPRTHACNGECGPMRYSDTGGSLQAIALTIEPYCEVGKWRFSVEGGPEIFKETWTSTMTVM